jgi:hypothetical protein
LIGGFLVLASFDERAVRGQEAKFIDSPEPKLETLEDVHSFPPLEIAGNFTPGTYRTPAPIPKIQAPRDVHRARFALDRAAIALGFVQGASELYNGFTTRYFLHHCSTCLEVDPLSQFLLGSKPTWGGMIVAGSLEGLATTYLHQSLRHSPHRFARRCAPLAPLVLTGIHLIEGSQNLSLKNRLYCAIPGYSLTGNVCVPPAPAQTGSSAKLTPNDLAKWNSPE